MRLLANIVVLYLVFLRKLHRGLPSGVYGKEPACQCIRCLSPGSGKSPGEGHGNPLQYLAWRLPWTEGPDGLHTVHRVTKSPLTPSLFHFQDLVDLFVTGWPDEMLLPLRREC